MLKIATTSTFDDWLETVPQKSAQLSVAARITRLEAGDVEGLSPVGQGVLHLQVEHGAGIDLYLMALLTPDGNGFTLLSASNDGSTQASNISKAAILAAHFKD